MPVFIPNPTVKQLCDSIDQFLPDDEESVKAFLSVLYRFVDHDDDSQALDFEVVRNHAITRTTSYAQFVSQFTGTPFVTFSDAEAANEEPRELVH